MAKNAKRDAVQSTLLHPLPPFPLDCYPTKLDALVSAVAEAFSVPIEVPAIALLALASGCIGRTRGIEEKTGWVEHANLYLAVVAQSGLGKSPCVRAFFAPINRLEKKWFDEWQAETEAHRMEM